jgi:hypothetical protein
VAAGAQTDLDEKGIAKNAREEQLQARRKKQMTDAEERHHAEMARLYRQHVLKEDPNLVPVGVLKATARRTDGDGTPGAARRNSDTPEVGVLQ